MRIESSSQSLALHLLLAGHVLEDGRVGDGDRLALGLDAGVFKSCVDGQETVAQVQASRAFGDSLGIASTPSIFFNGEPYAITGRDYGYGALEERIKAAAAGGE